MAERKRKPNHARGETSRGYFAYEGLDRVLHEKARLGILTALRTRNDGLVFGELKELCSLTDGNLSRHLTVLLEAGLIELEKATTTGRPLTRARLTAVGKTQFDAYLEELQRVIQDASIRIEPSRKRRDDLPPDLAHA
ncbi:MAG: transcriptional regulator [Planctomycetes bacterium]|nr:transcriptional regulator [Planctomycetota bacterium]MCB9871381.1 transcriptional regulator [Planctomycetota bacterium]MCB9888635.1 transcriptional regulator [Planctomycetota bacterium]